MQKEFLYYFGLMVSFECFLLQNNLNVTEDIKVEDPCGKTSVF